LSIDPVEFERLVEEALDSLPERFADLLENIVVVVEEEPNASDLDVMDDPNGELLGIYRGTPLTQRSYSSFRMPDQVAIFRGPILRVTRGTHEAKRQIRETVIHEVGHHFGLSDHDMVY
jgi:predicted Zn-dependent protease with MMP-like domain